MLCMKEKQMKDKIEYIIPNVGRIVLPDDFENFFDTSGTYLISQRFGQDYFFEMNGEFLYYTLSALGKETGTSYRSYKERIITAILKRKEACDGFFYHQGFCGQDTQLRATSAVIRVLLQGESEGLADKSEIIPVVNKHFLYYLPWQEGIWFCHDTSEHQGEKLSTNIASRVWGKDERNTLTLNTHIDSLNTLLLLLLHDKRDYWDGDILELVNKGLIPLKYILDKSLTKSPFRKMAEHMDNYFFRKELKRLTLKKDIRFFPKVYERLVYPYFFKMFFPTVFFENGFIARDLSVRNRHIDYQMVNIVDFLRLIILYKAVREKGETGLLDIDIRQLTDFLGNAVKLAGGDACFRQYLENNAHILALYLESLVYMSSLTADPFYPEEYKFYKEAGFRVPEFQF